MDSIGIPERVVYHVLTVTDRQFADLSVGTLAYSFDIDRYKLSRQFKRHNNMTLEKFLFKEKMSRAAFLLKAVENITVREVAERIGFCTSGYFIQKFKEYYGIRPGKYKMYKASINIPTKEIHPRSNNPGKV